MSDRATPALIPVEEEGAVGPAMQALPNDRWRAFVLSLVQLGCDATRAAELAGFSSSSRDMLWKRGYQLAHDARVQAAIHEECLRLIRTDGPMALSVLRTVAQDKTAANRDRIKAATEILNRGGFHAVSEHHVSVSHQTDAEKDREILALANELGLDDAAKQKLLGRPIITDAQFTVIGPPAVSAAGSVRRAETPEEREARHERVRAERRERGKREYAAAQAARQGLEDLLPPLEPLTNESGGVSDFNPEQETDNDDL